MDDILLKEARKYLERDPLSYVDMLDGLERGLAQVLAASEDAALLRFCDDCRCYSVAAASPEALEKLMPLIVAPETVIVHGEGLAEPLAEHFGFQAEEPARQVVYTKKTPIKLPEIEGLKLRDLTMEELPFVRANYKLIDSEEYIIERIEEGMIGACYRGELAGFVGLHDEGAMGLLEVLPQFRRMGIGAALEAEMVNRQLARGRTPYAQVIWGNENSMKLQRKLGFEFALRPLTWLSTD